jgi:DNA-3-methyladenine glycosylase
MLKYPDPLPLDWFNRASTVVAPDLIGCTLVRTCNGETIRGQIVETEAYEAGDPAMAAYRNRTERNSVVFGSAGVAYVYRIYRQYHCFNIVTDRKGFASTILMRAVDLEQWPSWIAIGKEKLVKLAAGPGKLCRTFQIDTSLKGLPMHPDSGLWVEARSQSCPTAITQTTRIGLSKGTDLPWRWYLTNSRAVSRR